MNKTNTSMSALTLFTVFCKKQNDTFFTTSGLKISKFAQQISTSMYPVSNQNFIRTTNVHKCMWPAHNTTK